MVAAPPGTRACVACAEHRPPRGSGQGGGCVRYATTTMGRHSAS